MRRQVRGQHLPLVQEPGQLLLGRLPLARHGPGPLTVRVERGIALGLIERGPERMGEMIVFPDGRGGTMLARIVSPVFYDPKGERQDV